MNPWKIIGWIVLAGVVLMLAFCTLVLYRVGSERAKQETADSAAPPAYVLQVVKVECVSRGRDRADVTVRNAGVIAVPYAKAFAEFKDKAGAVVGAHDSFFSPHDIPPGATASATIYASGSGAHSCQLTAIQDGDGNAVTLQ